MLPCTLEQTLLENVATNAGVATDEEEDAGDLSDVYGYSQFSINETR